MPLSPDQQAANRSAKETIKAFARKELGLEIGDMPPEIAINITLAAVIVKIQEIAK